ncbi:MAG: DUF4131 domain-containing protein, partial [Synergistaceae bacterium]|nr:DUF4131 domain-containing protein [Synergistaceae bacterium]
MKFWRKAGLSILALMFLCGANAAWALEGKITLDPPDEDGVNLVRGVAVSGPQIKVTRTSEELTVTIAPGNPA